MRVGGIGSRRVSFNHIRGVAGRSIPADRFIGGEHRPFNAVTNRIFPAITIIGHVLDLVVSLAVLAGCVVLIFKYLPDVQVPWKISGPAGVAARYCSRSVNACSVPHQRLNRVAVWRSRIIGAASSRFISRRNFVTGAEFTVLTQRQVGKGRRNHMQSR